jgi:hypothetical protein
MNFKALSVLALSGLGGFDEVVRVLELGMVLKSEFGFARWARRARRASRAKKCE